MAAPTETSGAFGMFAGMARSYRKIERFRDILGHGSHHHPPVPAEMAATCGRSGPCPRWCLPSCTLAAPLVVAAACSCPHTIALTTSCIAGMARSYRKMARFRSVRGYEIAPSWPVSTEMAATCGWSGPCPRYNRIKPKSHASTDTRPSVAPARPEADWPAHTARHGAHPPGRAGHDRETPAATMGRVCP